MKTMNFIKALVAFIFVGTLMIGTSIAAKTSVAPAKDVHAIITETVKYPPLALKESIEGTVEVLFTVNDEGKILIEKIKSNDKRITDDITEQLSKICCKEILGTYNQHYKVLLEFKIV
jgi:outer membrane biosynthesis protein TonB